MMIVATKYWLDNGLNIKYSFFIFQATYNSIHWSIADDLRCKVTQSTK